MNAVNIAPIVNAVNRMQGQVNDLTVQVGRVDANVGRVSHDVQTTRGELQALTAEFRQFVHNAQLTANVQRSETALGNAEAALDREYGHYKVVRRTSVGTLQAFDVGNVTNDTVQQISEELMIQTPRYWLAPALVALAAWSRDDRELADKSVQTAFTRDGAKTSLFFALVLRRQGRVDASARWLRYYLSALDPRALGREFAVVYEAAAHDAFGTHGYVVVGTQLSEWNGRLRTDPIGTRRAGAYLGRRTDNPAGSSRRVDVSGSRAAQSAMAAVQGVVGVRVGARIRHREVPAYQRH
ncbi:hypothetical protein MWU77_17340 [Rhodococcus sp. F64268]|uniref:hypothetical protein n=1 Tax=Rhodococcus sp. F64268 TaxID=2926402 RepID=UPI001FF246EF|nr:hypothetical protein [Rhodococcus sp. F64268]MCK0092544.1 hypothetical protein [Rhodococcus sp. F64268]